MGNARSTAVANRDREIEASQSRAIAAREAEQPKPRNALEAMASRLKISAPALQKTLRSTVFSGCRTDEEFFALVIVANEYGLNPLLKEIYAFPAKGGGIVPMVSIDGWIRLMNSHPQFDGLEFDHIHDPKGNLSAIEAIIHRKDRSRPIKVMETLEENKRGTEPWKLMPNRMLRHRALIQAVRIAFGFSGIQDETETDMIDVTPQTREIKSLPGNRTMGEELNDEIPNFDGETGEVIEKQTEPARDEQTGMTEVTEEEARALDAGEGEQEDEGEAAEAEGPAAKRLREFEERLNAATTKQQVMAIDVEFTKERAVFDDEDAALMDALITRRAKALPNEGTK